MSERYKPTSSQEHDNSVVFSDYAHYYDLLYRDKDYQAEADYVAGLIRRFHPGARLLMELGCGTGKHALLLADLGFSIHGIERSPEMLALALEATADNRQSINKGSLSFSEGDIRTVRLTERFDVIIALFHVISYQTTNEDVTAAFKTARHHLQPGGIFIFDVWYGPAVLTERPEVRIKRMADSQTEITRLAEPVLHHNENLVDVNYHVFVRDRATGAVKELQETHVMRYFFKLEIELIASHNGLSILNAEEWLTGKSIGPNTWGACFLMKVLTA